MQQSICPEKLTQGCAQLEISLSSTQCTRLCRHLELLAQWNRTLNLTAIQNIDDMVTLHLLDSLSIAPFVRGQTILDIGSGGGFPGIPLAVINPEIQVTLIDSRGKRVEFLRYVCATLGLRNVQVAASRVENYQSAEKVDTLATRAFASFKETLRMTAGLHHPGGQLLAMKGRHPAHEIACLDPVLRMRVTVEKLQVPLLDAERHLIIAQFR